MFEGAVVLRTEPATATWFDDRVRAVLSMLTATFASLREECGNLPEAKIEVVVTEDVAASIRALGPGKSMALARWVRLSGAT